MIKKALCIGNAQYPEAPLKNPANDARDLSRRLEALGFSCRLSTDASYRSMNETLKDFALEMSGAEVGLFFFAGHGMQISGENYLTAVDTDFTSETDAKYSSLPLNKVIDVLEKGDNSTSIIILDACRNNPYERRWRGGEYLGLAPVYAPKGTIIAFATSPGQTAFDGDNQNGAYTSALLNHIGNQNLTIEDLFKRVRNTLSAMTSGKQTSWEHTSLMGDFLFNPSVLTDEFIAEYSSQAKADANFHVASSPLREVIDGLKSHNWYIQNPAMSGLASVEWSRVSKDDLFVLGRNLYQAACGGSNEAATYFSYLSLKLGELEKEVAFHILNGMLYEIYFDSSDRFRDEKKVGRIADVFALEGDERFHPSFQFIQQSLRPYSKQLFYIPGTERPVVVDVVVVPNKENKFEVKRIIYDSQDVLYASDGVTLVTNFGFTSSYMEELSETEFEIKLASLMAVPRNRLVVTFSDNRAKDTDVLLPYYSKIQRLSN
jgi:hypothetical protein